MKIYYKFYFVFHFRNYLIFTQSTHLILQLFLDKINDFLYGELLAEIVQMSTLERLERFHNSYIYNFAVILQSKFMHGTKWSFEASGVYISYSSIAEKRMSSRRNLNAKEREIAYTCQIAPSFFPSLTLS